MTPATDTKIENAEPGKNACPPEVRLNVVFDPSNCEEISSSFR